MTSWLERVRKLGTGATAKCTGDGITTKKRLTKAEREEKRRKRQEKETRELILEVSFYVIFLILLVSTASSNRDSKAFGYRHSTLSFIDAQDAVGKIRTVDQFWSWIHHALLPFLYPSLDWNNGNLTHSPRLVATRSSYRVGPLRIRQHRTRDESCSIEPHFQKMDIRCVYSWSSSYMDTRNYTRGWKAEIHNDDKTTLHQWSGWDYRNWWAIGGTPVMGMFGVYPSGGYVIDISGNIQTARKAIQDLKHSEWIDSLTRFVSVEFSLFCPGANLFAMVPVEFEFPQSDIMMGKAHLYPFRLFSYLGGYPTAQMACDVLVYMAIVWFVTREVYKVAKERCKYFTQFWNILELLNLLLSITAITLYIGRLIITTYVSKDMGSVEGQYYNFQTLAMWNELFGILLGFVCFLSTLQLLHLLRFNRRMSLFGATLKEAAKDLSAFFLVFIIVFLAFVSLSCVTFGSNLVRYSSVIRSIETLVTVALGNFDYYALTYVNHTLAPIFLFAYMMFIVFILINMLITILNDAFSVVRDDVSKQPNDYELVDYILSRVTAFLAKPKPLRVLWNMIKSSGKVTVSPPSDTGRNTSDKVRIEVQKRQPYNTIVDHRPRNRHRSAFNANFVRLHNRLDNILYLIDHSTQILEAGVSKKDSSNKKPDSIGTDPFYDCHILSLSLNESGSSSNEHVVPIVYKVRSSQANFIADLMDNVVPQADIPSDSHFDLSVHSGGEARNMQNIESINLAHENILYNTTENGSRITREKTVFEGELFSVVPELNDDIINNISSSDAYSIEMNNWEINELHSNSYSMRSKTEKNNYSQEHPLQNYVTTHSQKPIDDVFEDHSEGAPQNQTPSSIVTMPEESYSQDEAKGLVDDPDQHQEREMSRVSKQDEDGVGDQVVVDIDDQESSM